VLSHNTYLMEYSKDHQIRAGSKEAKELLKRSFGRSREPKKRSGEPKYRNKKQLGDDGSMYDSLLECAYGNLLFLRKKTKDIADYKRQVCLHLYVNGEKICDYFIDFVVTHTNGRTELVEVKGFPTPEWKKKWNLTKALIPTGEIPGVPKDALLTLVKKGTKKGFDSQTVILNYK